MFVPKRLSKSEREAVRALLGTGLSDYEISRRTGVGRSTICQWRLHGIPVPPVPIQPVLDRDRWNVRDREVYAHLLGLYLGDGHVSTHGNTHGLVIALDLRYKGVIRLAMQSVGHFSPRPPSVLRPKGTNGVRVTSYWKA